MVQSHESGSAKARVLGSQGRQLSLREHLGAKQIPAGEPESPAHTWVEGAGGQVSQGQWPTETQTQIGPGKAEDSKDPGASCLQHWHAGPPRRAWGLQTIGSEPGNQPADLSFHKAGVLQTEGQGGALQIRALPGTADTCVGTREAGVWAYRGEHRAEPQGLRGSPGSCIHSLSKDQALLVADRSFPRLEDSHLKWECFSLPPKALLRATTLHEETEPAF